MATLTSVTIKIATKENVNNVFIFSLLKKMATEKPFYFESIVLSKNREYVIANCIPDFVLDVCDFIKEISTKYPFTFSTFHIHSFGNTQPITLEYIIVYKNGEAIFKGDYPFIVFDKDGEIPSEKIVEAIRNRLEADKKEWFPTFYQNLESLNPDEEDIVWKPSSKEVAEKSSEKLTEKEKDLLASMFEYLRLIGFVDVDGEEDEVLEMLNEKELEAKTAQKIQVIQDKILGKDYSCYDPEQEENAE